MLIVMDAHASADQIEQVCQLIVRLGYAPHAMPGPTRTAIGITGNQGPIPDVDQAQLERLPAVREVIRVTAPYKLVSREFHEADTIVTVGAATFGGLAVAVIAGPCTVESREQVLEVAQAVRQAGAVMLRGGAFKPRTSPYSFQGLGEEGLKLMRRVADQHGLLVISEIMDKSQISLMDRYVDIFQVGARNMQNYPLLRELGKVERPVLVKRGLAATVDEWLMSAEYVISGGNDRVIVCERGVRAYETYTRNTLDLNAVAVAKSISHLPVIVDPSHAAGVRDKVVPLARAAIATGADGLLVEVHHDPERAICDGPQSLFPQQFEALAAQIRLIAEAVGRSL